MSGTASPIEPPGFSIEEYDARRCHLCGAMWPGFGFGPPLPVRTTIWACFTHRGEVERLARDGRFRATNATAGGRE